MQVSTIKDDCFLLGPIVLNFQFGKTLHFSLETFHGFGSVFFARKLLQQQQGLEAEKAFVERFKNVFKVDSTGSP